MIPVPFRISAFPFFALREKACFTHGFTELKEQEILGAYTSFTPSEMQEHFGDELTSLNHHPFQELYRINSADGLTLRTTQHDSDDAAFVEWMEGFVLKNQDNPYVPKVRSYARFNTGRTITIMEDLSLLPHERGINTEVQNLSCFLLSCFSDEKHLVREALREGYDEKTLLAALIFIKKYSGHNSNRYSLGIQSCLDRQGQFVFLDPLVA
ncbi:MAG: hypothetical protein VX730_07135 [Pseudomonadota bacterium]|nr:hypothetical protein [Pseudomonadota bacterium]